MGTRTSLFIGWQGASTISTVLSTLLDASIELPADDEPVPSDNDHDDLASDLNRRLKALSLPEPVTLSFLGCTDYYSNSINGMWTLAFEAAQDGRWVGGHDGLSGEALDVGAFKATSAAAQRLARSRRLPLPALNQITVSEG